MRIKFIRVCSRKCVVLLISALACISCNKLSFFKQPLFEVLDAKRTNVDFENIVIYNNDFNIYKYRNYYNGGGVGLGDVNNDGLVDIFLISNLYQNKLYLNKGDLTFEDVTEQAKVGGTHAWSTGVAMVDINADGWLDIHVSNSGFVSGDDRRNEFFINNGDGTFSEKAKELGLDDPGLSINASFFDYDKDGDLDAYVINNSYQSIRNFNLKKDERPIRDKQGGDRLYRNDNGKFVDVSEEAGIYGSIMGFALSVGISDIDKDGWPDIYVCNDFFERDYLYMNNGDGTFREELEDRVHSITLASMGSDFADMNADGYPEYFVTEMLPNSDDRFKTKMTFEGWDKYQLSADSGFHYQLTRNMFQRHNGIMPGKGVAYSEIGRQAGVEATEWSWSVLLTDLDNDSHKDIYVTNGIAQDVMDQDYLNHITDKRVMRMVVQDDSIDYRKLIDIIPTFKLSNFAYAGDSKLGFQDKTKEWGIDIPSLSNGAAYGDLDNDGDLELVVNNVNMPLFIFNNQVEKVSDDCNFIKFILHGDKKNKNAFGTKVTLKAGGRMFYQEEFPYRGFQSTVDSRLNFGLGSIQTIDSIIVDWPYESRTILTNVQSNQIMELYEKDANTIQKQSIKKKRSEMFIDKSKDIALDYRHLENRFSDFDRDRLLYHMKSNEGPKIAIADVNGDGIEDFYICGAKDSSGKLFVQDAEGHFESANDQLFEKDKDCEDRNCIFFDADGDEDMDLYVASGGNELSSSSFLLFDRLYMNDGDGNFVRSRQTLPTNGSESTSVVKNIDYDNDGDQDLFVGIRLKTGFIGIPQNGYILENDGNGNFKNVTEKIAPGLLGLGMITDAEWNDYDRDGDSDLMVVGEWMGIKLFNNQNGILTDISSTAGLNETSGWWNSLKAGDIDSDGDIDFVAGNHGTNSRFKANKDNPIECYINDFDRNGTIEQITCMYHEGKPYPTALLHDLVLHLPPYLKKKYSTYESYKNQSINQIFSKGELEGSFINRVTMLETVMLINNGDGSFSIEVLPDEAQISPVYAIYIDDMDQDGNKDILLGGNLFPVKPEFGRYDASYGVFLKGDGKNNFEVLPSQKSGFVFEGEVRDIKAINIGGSKTLMVARSNEPIQFYDHK
ncbi:VCBS repeat-containing protein [Sunxiuqinia sp. A32]|uniref:VCBS repeat-containing protein n=1 Tax=Sunxiuqinia sp. A32 TaxID=3461496 RepID=UPI0040458326